MISHAPSGYACPFCAIVAGHDNGLSGPADVVLRTADAFALVAAHWWPHDPGHVLVVPAAHHDNLYDLPAAVGTPSTT